MNNMSLPEILRAFRDRLGLNFMGQGCGMVMAFYVSVRDRALLTDVDAQNRIVHVLYVQDSIEFHGQKGFMPIVLWNSATESQTYIDIKSWQVIDDRTIRSEGSIDAEMDVLVATLMRQYQHRRPGSILSANITFFVHGVPQIIQTKGFTLSEDRKTCVVKF